MDPVAIQRFVSQRLSGTPFTTVEGVVRHLLAVQAQDGRGARLAVRARSTGLTASAVNAALTDERSVLITTLNRGTLHLIHADDYPLLHVLTTPPLIGAIRQRLHRAGVDDATAQRAVRIIRGQLAGGPKTRLELRDALLGRGIEAAHTAMVHFLAQTTLEGWAIRGPMAGAQHCFVLVEDWLGPQRFPERDAALTELARRYLAAHAPAGETDLANWAKLPLRDVRRAFRSLGSALVERPDGNVELTSTTYDAADPPSTWLGPFDAALHGWRSRRWILGDHDADVVSGGVFRAVALQRGHPVATWGWRSRRVVAVPLPGATVDVTPELAADRADVERFLTS